MQLAQSNRSPGISEWGILCLVFSLFLFSTADASAYLGLADTLAWSEGLVDGENADCEADLEVDGLTAVLASSVDHLAGPARTGSIEFHRLRGWRPLPDDNHSSIIRPPPSFAS